jgi:hypothetical protein
MGGFLKIPQIFILNWVGKTFFNLFYKNTCLSFFKKKKKTKKTKGRELATSIISPFERDHRGFHSLWNVQFEL